MLKINKNKKVKISKVNKTLNRVSSANETIAQVESARRIISETLYVKDNIAVDLKNFSMMSVTQSRDIL